jgi:hypothetical protein
MMMFTTHAPACSDGKYPLDLAIDGNNIDGNKHDTIAFLRSLPLYGVGTPDNGLLESAMLLIDPELQTSTVLQHAHRQVLKMLG